MKALQRILMCISIAGLAGLAGCVTARRPTTPPPPVVQIPVAEPQPAAAKPAPSAPAPVAPAPEAAAPAPSPVPPPPPPPSGDLTMLVESAPADAIIVVNGRPVGKTPLRLVVPATPQGFFRDYTEIRARFVATIEGMDSHTTTEEFTPRERVPAVLHFTPEGAQRLLQ